MRVLVVVVGLSLLGCREGGGKPRQAATDPAATARQAAPADAPAAPAVAVALEPTAAADAAVAAIGSRLVPEGPILTLAEIRPHLVPLGADCKAGSDLACAVLDNLYMYGAALARKAAASEVEALDKACRDRDDLAACALAGEAVVDPAKARQANDLFGLACFRGFGRACARMGLRRLSPGAGDPTFSEERAASLIADSCKARDADACAHAGDLEALGRACDLGSFASCSALASKGAGRERLARGLAIFGAARRSLKAHSAGSSVSDAAVAEAE